MTTNKEPVSAEWLSELRDTLHYDPDTGRFMWLKWRGAKARAGSEAGATDSKGHRQIRFKMKLYMAHRLAWVLSYGRWPEAELDHINRVRADNRLVNLRECSHRENSANRSVYKSNTSGVPGVSFYPKYGKWTAQIRVAGKAKGLGYFDNMDDAIRARNEAVRTHYGEFAPEAAA